MGRRLTDEAFKSKRLGLVFLSLIVLASFIYELTPVDGIVLCPIRASTGMECGGCGMTRSWVALAHGEWHLSMLMNPFGPLLFGLAVAKVTTLAVEVRRRKVLVMPWWERVKVPILGTVAAGLIGLSLIRAFEFFSS